MRMPEAASISFIFTHLSHAPYPGDEAFCRYSSTTQEEAATETQHVHTQ